MLSRASYIAKNNELFQEVYFAHPVTKIKLNNVYNSHFSGSQIWDLFCDETIKLENTWNRSVRIMYDLPYETHRYFIQELADGPHLKKTLIKRFLSFMTSIQKSKKSIPKLLLETIKYDVRSVTGSNLRKIAKLVKKDAVDDLVVSDALTVEYHEMKQENEWKVGIIRELTDVKFNSAELDEFTADEMEHILFELSTN